jgi:hypothetical protein
MSPSPLAWALHSPGRFLAVLAGCVALLVALATIGLWGGSSGSERRAAEQRPVAETHAARVTESDPTDHSDQENESIGPAARRTVERFLKGYLAPTSRQELELLRPLCTSDLWAGLRVSDPSNMPRGPVKRIEKIADGAFTARFTADLSRSSLVVDVVLEPDGVRVASVEPEKP